MIRNCVAALSLAAVAGTASGQTVQFRIIERTGQSVANPADPLLELAVQAKVTNGLLGGFNFDIHTADSQSGGTLQQALICNLDHTYYSGAPWTSNSIVGRGGVAATYSYLAGIDSSRNGLINTSGGTFTANPLENEIGYIAGLARGGALLGTPNLDSDGDGNPDTSAFNGSGMTLPNGSTAAVDPSLQGPYFADGQFIDVYRFRYTVTNFTSRTLHFTLPNLGAQFFTQFLYDGVAWGAQNVTAPGAAVSVSGLDIQVTSTASNVPPVVVTSLSHSQVYSAPSNQTVVRDGITMPSGPGTWTNSGFTASFGTGDTVFVRIEAPSGQQFNLTPAAGAMNAGFGFDLDWATGTNDSTSSFPAATVTFENFAGAAMTNTTSLSGVSNAGQLITVNLQYTLNGACSFTALQMSFPITETLARVARTYNAAQGLSSPALSATATYTGNSPPNSLVLSLGVIPLPGTCCRGTTCTSSVPLNCTGGNALFLGSGVACSPVVRGGTINACCPADFDGANGLQVADVFAFLNAWFAGCP
jgi:hypothetical protein